MKFLSAFTAESQGSENSLQDSGDLHRAENLKKKKRRKHQQNYYPRGFLLKCETGVNTQKKKKTNGRTDIESE